MSTSSSSSSSSSSVNTTTPVTSYKTMLSYVMVDVPNASDQIMLQALGLAGRKFCLDTELYEKELDPIDVVASTQTYSLSALLPSWTYIIRLKDVWYGTDATNETTTPWDTTKYTLYQENTFKFVTTPTESITDGLVVSVILRPTAAAKCIETWFYDRYFEPILAYAKYYLLKMDSNKGWADMNRAQMYLEEYTSYINKYKVEKFRQYKSSDVHIAHTPSRF